MLKSKKKKHVAESLEFEKSGTGAWTVTSCTLTQTFLQSNSLTKQKAAKKKHILQQKQQQ